MKHICYMAVTNDQYELPIYVADTVAELAELLGIKKQTVSHHVSSSRIGRKYKIVRVKLDEE